jgi:glutathione synthase/RimK-type ligase-like ATP-grasp enzyme
LLLARRNRVSVPQTIITTDLSHARRAFGCPRLVIKAVDQHFVEAQPGRLTGIFPTVVERRDLPDGPGPGPPVVVQEYVEHDAELRVYYAAGRIAAYEVSKDSPAAPWTDPAGVRVRPVESPASVDEATRLLASAMGLRFGAFDFLIRAGTPVFLEVNPDGDWRWAERMSRTTLVTLAAARMLTELHHEMRLAMPRTVDHGIKPLNLLAFLSRPGLSLTDAPLQSTPPRE